MNWNEFTQKTGIAKPLVYVPNENVDLTKWAVIACDQHTSPGSTYWQEVAEFVADNPSTLNLVFPEYYLEQGEEALQQRVAGIQAAMNEYLERGILKPLSSEPKFIYIRRTLGTGIREGIMVLLDLEQYSYKKGERPLIRPTEGTIEERLPVRIKIREKAPLEFPHILMLLDDPNKTAIEPLANEINSPKMNKSFDFELMKNGGHFESYIVEDSDLENQLAEALLKLADVSEMLIAAGDGNHSLATAKAVWEAKKQELIKNNEPWQSNSARFALVELINIHNSALVFEPIHRVIYNTGEWAKFMENMIFYYESNNSKLLLEDFDNLEALLMAVKTAQVNTDTHTYGLSYQQGDQQFFKLVKITPPVHTLPVGSLQLFLDQYLKGNSQARIDYLHGSEAVKNDSSQEGNIGFYLPALEKNKLFESVIKEGVTPRKTISMGEAETKAYYIFGRKIS